MVFSFMESLLELSEIIHGRGWRRTLNECLMRVTSVNYSMSEGSSLIQEKEPHLGLQITGRYSVQLREKAGTTLPSFC